MRIVRFLDDKGETRFGHDFQNGEATLLVGESVTNLTDTGERVSVKKLLAPLQPSNIFGIGLNYHDHAKEIGAEAPQYPILFMKNTSTIQNPNDPIKVPAICMDPPEVDYEVELAFIIGKDAKNVKAADALDYVFGYTVCNDVSSRRWQKNAGAGQWVRSKSFDTFCPIGPEIVTADEIPDPQNLSLKTILNGEVMQDGNTKEMIFTIAEVIEYLSEEATIPAGSMVITGTPGGVGFSRTPAVYLKPGDQIEVSIEGIGSLANPVEAA